MPLTQAEKTARFRALHAAPGSFVIANAWDAGSARILTGLGFPALATSSGAAAGVLGRLDGQITRSEKLDHARAIVAATDLPVSADLEKGFGDTPDAVAETIRLVAEIGLAGGSIEDASGDPAHPLFDFSLAVDRIMAAVEAARATGTGFVLTGRTENYLRGNPDLDDTIRRLVAFQNAGADVLMAPGLPDLASVRAVCSALDKPFNFMAGIRGRSFTIAALTDAGVKRISLATSLFRGAMSAVVKAATEVRDHGTFDYINTDMSSAELGKYFS